MTNNVIKLHVTDTDDCVEFIDDFRQRVINKQITSIMYIGIDANNQAFFGKVVNHSEKLAMLGAIELIKQNIVDSFEEDYDGR
jgi:predicted DNA-binding ArsR family transcriptional regulator